MQGYGQPGYAVAPGYGQPPPAYYPNGVPVQTQPNQVIIQEKVKDSGVGEAAAAGCCGACLAILCCCCLAAAGGGGHHCHRHRW